MYNRYRGNGSKPERVEDAVPQPQPRRLPQNAPPKAAPVNRRSLSDMLPGSIGRNLSELETEDIILILILYLMYRESGDKELLLIIGAMYLL